ncbi:MAG: RNA 2',3'-cyclic phosphodiesterase [Deltaproteobacteria bacterium]|nr:RNA 2',3'-cyclic phosphodiesterase [Deltaproteobacteria bacterium]
MTDHKRLFVGARVSVPTANALSGVVETLARRARDAGFDIRWVAPVSYHVTLAFLGNTRIDAIAAVHDALEVATVATAPIKFRTTRVGAFPSVENPRVVWAGVEDGGELTALANRIAGGISRLGYGDRKPFHAHVTLGRVKDTPPKLASIREVVLPLAEQMFGDTRIDAISLFESETKSSGSVYREIHRVTFKTGPNAAPESAKRQTSELQVGAREAAVETEIETDDGWPRGHIPN